MRVAIATTDAIVTYMVFVAERDRLCNRGIAGERGGGAELASDFKAGARAYEAVLLFADEVSPMGVVESELGTAGPATSG